jgi:hypothetical protein
MHQWASGHDSRDACAKPGAIGGIDYPTESNIQKSPPYFASFWFRPVEQ